MPRRILFVLHQFLVAGVEAHTRDLVRGLQPDFVPAVVFPDDGHLVVADGSLTVVARLPGGKVSWPQAEHRIEAVEESFRRIVADFKPDIVHVQHLMNWPLNFLGWLTDLGIPVVLTLHDYFPISPVYTLQGVQDPEAAFSPDYCRQRLGQDITGYLHERRRILGDSLGKTSVVISPSPYLAEFTARIYPSPIRVVGHGIRKFERAASPKNDQVLRFGYFGGMFHQKGWEPLLAAFAEVRARFGRRVELLLFGTGYPDEPPPVEGVIVRGRFYPGQLPALMSEIDVGVIPSLFAETFSLALSEFWQARIPVAVSDIGALGERVQDGRDGRKFAPGDVQDMARVLGWFLESDEWRRWTLPSPRSMEDMIAEYRDLYSGLLAQAPR